METNKYCSTRLRHLREAKGIMQKEMADALGQSKTAVNNWEVQGNVPHASILCKLADYFDVSVDYLLGRTDKPETNR